MSYIKLGSRYGGWWVDLDRLDEHSVVYSAGVGEDITFDIELIKRTNCTVHAFDPTPKSIAWLGSQNLPPKFIAHPVGLSRLNGERKFFPPKNKEWVSHSVLSYDKDVDSFIVCEFLSLSTLMAELGHTHIDLLKMDIEGSEFEVFEDLVDNNIKVDQLNVEVHGDVDSGVRIACEKLAKCNLELVHSEGPNLFFEVIYAT